MLPPAACGKHPVRRKLRRESPSRAVAAALGRNDKGMHLGDTMDRCRISILRSLPSFSDEQFASLRCHTERGIYEIVGSALEPNPRGCRGYTKLLT
jgi:hypothetical protein